MSPWLQALGDELMSPFVSAGWSQQAERNVRPAQWLGLMKVLAAWGAEWLYSGFFSLRAPFPDPANWCWQALTPVYAQAAVVTQAADMYYKASLVLNDPNTSFAMGDDGKKASPLLWAGAPHVLALARKLGDDYLVVAATQRLSNNARNLGTGLASTGYERTSEVRIPGLPKPLVIKVRLQGVVVIVGNASSPHPTLTQLDGWHEASHPTRWRQASIYEAELYEGRFVAASAQHAASSGLVVTDVPDSAAHPLDFNAFTTFVDLKAARAPVCLRIAPPPTPRATAAASTQLHRRRVRVLARGGKVEIGGHSASVRLTATGDAVGTAPGWQWLEREEWGLATDAGGALLCLSGSAHVDKVELV